MSNAAEIRSRTNFYAGQLLVATLVFGYGLAAVFFLPAFQSVRIPAIYLIPVVLIYANVLAFIVAARGQNKIPTIPFVIGVALIFGGAIFDMLATVVHSPSLSLEGNIYARMLLDSGHSLSFIYGYAIVAQFLVQLLICVLWTAFLRHRQTIVALAWEANPKSKSEFVKAALGGEGYSWRQLVFSSKKPIGYYKRVMYHLLMFIVCALIGMTLYRWWLGAEWFGIVPNVPDALIAAPLMIIGISLYITGLLREYAAGKQPST